MKWLRGFIVAKVAQFREAYARECEGEDHAKVRYEETAEVIAGEDYIDWSKVPEGYDWVAIDSAHSLGEGRPWGYSQEPKINDSNRWYLKGRPPLCCEITKDMIIGSLPDWRDSLRRRPR
jgi:hypothetical protein